MKATKTIFFERIFGVDISSFRTTKEVDEEVSRRRNKKIRVVEIESSLIHNHFYDIERLVDEALNE